MAADRGPRAGGPGLSKKQTRTHCTEPNAQLTTLQKRFGESKYPTTSGRSPSWIASLPNIWLKDSGALVTGSCHRAPLESAHRTGTGQVGLRKVVCRSRSGAVGCSDPEPQLSGAGRERSGAKRQLSFPLSDVYGAPGRPGRKTKQKERSSRPRGEQTLI